MSTSRVQIEGERVPAYRTELRYCGCGTRLSGYNQELQCSACIRREIDNLYKYSDLAEIRKEKTVELSHKTYPKDPLPKPLSLREKQEAMRQRMCPSSHPRHKGKSFLMTPRAAKVMRSEMERTR